MGGRRSFFETHVVEKGESLWKILGRKLSLTPERYSERLKEFRRANPQIADPSRLSEGQKILVPSGDREEGVEDGRAVAHIVRKGDTLSRIFVSRGVPGSRLEEFFEATRELNPAVEDVNLIYSGRTLLLPTEAYFKETPTQLAAADPPEPPVVAEPPAPEPAAAPLT
ncbi:MAG: LysM peptidoglycan-binding domain-containing protein, partial [Deltaproteobacteria bacterium]|nr:LysM peptidoglycan-binding domain-containing protein [Deltaproteobacteria bacterium]